MRIQDRADAFVRELGAPGVCVLRSARDAPAEVAESGVLSTRKGTPLTAGARFPISCIMKLLIAVCALKLVRERRLDFHADVADYIPSLALPLSRATGITPFHLITHTAGYVEPRDRDVRWGYTWDRFEAFFPHRRQSFEPGKIWSYSHTGFALLARILEGASGEPIDQLLKKYVLEPLQLDLQPYDAVNADERAALHMRSSVTKTFVPVALPADSRFFRYSVSDLTLPLIDMHRLARAMSTKEDAARVGLDDIWHELINPVVTIPPQSGAAKCERIPTGYGLGIGAYGSARGINGSFMGSTCSLRFDVVEAEAQVVAMNAWSPVLRDALQRETSTVVSDAPTAKPRLTCASPQNLIGDYVGLMIGAPDIKIAASPGGLAVLSQSGSRWVLQGELAFHENEMSIRAVQPNFALGLHCDATGTILWIGTSAYARTTDCVPEFKRSIQL